jgi:hypothetical protein
MGKRVFVSADWKEPYDKSSWDKNVVDRIRRWGTNKSYGVEIDCTDDVHDSVMDNTNDCRRCEIKGECGRHINWSSIVIFVVGDKTGSKESGACDGISCSPAYSWQGKKNCKYKTSPAEATGEGGVVGGNNMSYLKHEINRAALAGKSVVLVYNSMLNKSKRQIAARVYRRGYLTLTYGGYN